MIRLRFSALGGLAACALLCGTAAAQERFSARITMVPIEMSMRATVTGGGAASATLDGRHLVVTGQFSGMQSAATEAQLRIGPVTGVRGAVSHTLVVEPGTEGRIEGDFELDPAEVEALRSGRFYIQVNSQGAPEGNLWGWFLP